MEKTISFLSGSKWVHIEWNRKHERVLEFSENEDSDTGDKNEYFWIETFSTGEDFWIENLIKHAKPVGTRRSSSDLEAN